MRVTLLSYTRDAERLCAAAAHSCYSEKPASELMEEWTEKKGERWLGSPLDSGHHSVIEHANYTFSIEGVSRSMTHQLVRHRLASFSQQSQRYVHMKDADYVVPESVAADPELEKRFRELMDHVWEEYRALSEKVPVEDARYVLPNACCTNITITMNARELWHFFELRTCRRCYDEATQVLTATGWKYFQELSKEDLFYSLNPDTGQCELVKAITLIEMPYSGPMVHVNAQSIDLLVTPEHKNYVSYSYDRKKFALDSVSNSLTKKKVLMKKNCLPIPGIKKETFQIPEVITERGNQHVKWQQYWPAREVPISDFFKFLGMYICDGYATVHGLHYMIMISEGDEKIAKKYVDVLQSLTPNKVSLIKDRTAWKVAVHDRSLFEFLKPLGKAKDKFIPDFVWEYDYTHLIDLYEGFCDGDMKKQRVSMQLSTVSKRLADDFQRLLLHIGYSGTITEVNRTDEVVDVISRSGQLRHLIYNENELFVNVNKTKNEPLIKTDRRDPFSTVQYTGKIFCVELEKNHILYVRRNWKTVWSGNSQAEIRAVADEMLRLVQEASPFIFGKAGPPCISKGKCSEGKMSCGRPRTELKRA